MNGAGSRPWRSPLSLPGDDVAWPSTMAGVLNLASLRGTQSAIRAVTFDVGGTLIKVWPSVGHVYAEVAARHGVEGISVRQLDQRFADAWHVFEDVVPTLEALSARGLRLGVISNWDERLRPLLERLRLAKHFEVIVVSREAGCSKPSGAIFKRAARKLELPTEAILHVGDDRSMDVRGARAAGLSALLLKRGAREGKTGQITSLAGLCGPGEIRLQS